MVRCKAETFEPVTKINQNESWSRRGPRGRTCSGPRDELDWIRRTTRRLCGRK
jgi:hypothetical protein